MTRLAKLRRKARALLIHNPAGFFAVLAGFVAAAFTNNGHLLTMGTASNLRVAGGITRRFA